RQLRELGDLAPGDAGQRAVRRQHLARDLDGRLAAPPRAELERDQLGIRERVGSVPVQPLPRTLPHRPALDRHALSYGDRARPSMSEGRYASGGGHCGDGDTALYMTDPGPSR